MENFNEKTQDFLSNHSNMSSDLAAAVIEQFGGEDEFIAEHVNVCEGGINCGISGWIWTDDLVEFYAENKKAIIKHAKETAESFGDDSVSEMVKGFGCLNNQFSEDEVAEGMYDTESDSHQQVAQALAFFVGEELSRDYECFLEENPNDEEDEDDTDE